MKSDQNTIVNRIAVSVPEMARMIGISRTKAYELANRADFPVYRIDGRLLVSVEGLKNWLENLRIDKTESV